ncbi:MAG TPA: acyl-CoA dehydrogenase family protein [Jatrophihabitantaceae bacterium]|nr:acyl-CoA dehydrogenase family protein [Jatrophihabitantaceae bacterium]
MDFTLDETQQAVADLAATVLRAEPDHGRATNVLAGAAGYDETLWKAMAQAGLLSLAVPTEHGGDGLGAVEVAAVLTEVGRQVQPLPALATLALAVLPLTALGASEHLTAVADGAVLTAALRPMVWSQGAVTGRASGVPYAAQAHRILVPVADGIALLAPDADGVSLTRTTTSTGAPEYTVQCTDTPAELVPGDASVLSRFAVAGAIAVADGVLAGALDLTASHVRDRIQFGRPLATFQAVAQEVGDVYVTARTIHLASTAVNWELANARDADVDIEIAAYWLAAELPAALQMCHHLHGGLGVDITYPLHRYYSHAKDLARMVGGAGYRLDRVGAACR